MQKTNTKPKSKPAGDQPAEPAPSPVKSLSELRAVIEKPIRLEMVFDNTKLTIEMRRLTPAEDTAIQEILDTVVPPIIPGKTPELDRPDYANLDYIRRKTAAEIEARSVALYWTVPIIRNEKPNLTNRREITEYVQSLMNAQVLTVLFSACRNGGVTLGELVNFTSSNPSVGS